MAQLKHVEYLDIDGSGIKTEVAVLKREENGDVYYINLEQLAPIDLSRIKKIIMSQHADKYDLYELMAMNKLSNGINALDFFHTNFAKVLRANGTSGTFAKNRRSINDVSINRDQDKVIGSEFTNPGEAELEIR